MLLDFLQTYARQLALALFFLIFLICGAFFRRNGYRVFSRICDILELLSAVTLFVLLLPFGLEILLPAMLALLLAALLC